MRRILALLAVLLVGAAAFPASAQAPYPNRPIRVVIPFGPGGFADITMRLVGQKLSERTGQQVVIENRPSAGGIVAAAAVTSAQPDGYTLFVLSSGIALSKSLLKTMPFDPQTAFAPVSTMALFDLLLLVKADSPMNAQGRARHGARRSVQIQHRHHQPGQHAERHRRAAAFDHRHSVQHRSAPQHRRSPDLAVARRHPDRGRVLRRVEIADRRRPDPRDRGQRRDPLADAAQRSDAEGKRPRRRGRGLELAGRAGRHSEGRSSPLSTAMSGRSSKATISRSACSTSAASPRPARRRSSTRD